LASKGFTVFSTVPRGINIDRNEDTTDLVGYIGMLEGWPLKTIGSPRSRSTRRAGCGTSSISRTVDSYCPARAATSKGFGSSGNPDRM
jgi:hypothetical protein